MEQFQCSLCRKKLIGENIRIKMMNTVFDNAMHFYPNFSQCSLLEKIAEESNMIARGVPKCAARKNV